MEWWELLSAWGKGFCLMPNYRIPNNTNNDANGAWKMNAVQRARAGGEWVDPYVPPPQSVQGWVSRYSGWASGNLSTYPANNMVNANSVYPQNGQFDAVTWTCTSHDWTLQTVQMGHGRNVGGSFYFRVTVFASSSYNTTTPVIDSGNQSMSMGYNNNVTNSVGLQTAPGWGESTLVLSQNQPYTIAINYWANAVAQPGYYYSGNGYGNAILQPSATITTTGAGGSTTITSNWQITSASGTNTYPYQSGPITASNYNGPIGLLKVLVHL